MSLSRPAASFPGSIAWRKETVRPKLAISLNASNDEQRDTLMPINKKYPLKDLLAACRRYPLRNWEHITFEYVMLGGVNDAPDDARRVVKLLAPLKRVKVNLIPWNPGELPFQESKEQRIEEFPPDPHRSRSRRLRPLFPRPRRNGRLRPAGPPGNPVLAVADPPLVLECRHESAERTGLHHEDSALRQSNCRFSRRDRLRLE